MLYRWSDSFLVTRSAGLSSIPHELAAIQWCFSLATFRTERRVSGAWSAVAGSGVAVLGAVLTLPPSFVRLHRSRVVTPVDRSGVPDDLQRRPGRLDASCACGRYRSRLFWRLGRRRGETGPLGVVRNFMPDSNGLHRGYERLRVKIFEHSTKSYPDLLATPACPYLAVPRLSRSPTQLPIPEGDGPIQLLTGAQECFEYFST